MVAALEAHRLHLSGSRTRELQQLLVSNPGLRGDHRFHAAALARLLPEQRAERLRRPAHRLPIHCPEASCSSIASSSAASAPFGSSSTPRSMARFARRNAWGGAFTISRVIASRTSCNREDSTMRQTNPAVRASSAVNARPVNIMSLARRLPSTRGSRCVAPTVPRSASGVRKRRFRGGDDEVAGGGDLATGADGGTVHDGDRRHRQRLERRVRRERTAAALAHLRLGHALSLLEVGAGAERRAVRAHQHYAHALVGARPVRAIDERVAHRQVHGVARLCSVQGNGRDAIPGEIRNCHCLSSARIFSVCSPSSGGRPISGLSQPRNL